MLCMIRFWWWVLGQQYTDKSIVSASQIGGQHNLICQILNKVLLRIRFEDSFEEKEITKNINCKKVELLKGKNELRSENM